MVAVCSASWRILGAIGAIALVLVGGLWQMSSLAHAGELGLIEATEVCGELAPRIAELRIEIFKEQTQALEAMSRPGSRFETGRQVLGATDMASAAMLLKESGVIARGLMAVWAMSRYPGAAKMNPANAQKIRDMVEAGVALSALTGAGFAGGFWIEASDEEVAAHLERIRKTSAELGRIEGLCEVLKQAEQKAK